MNFIYLKKGGCNDVYYTCVCITIEFNIAMRAPLQ